MPPESVEQFARAVQQTLLDQEAGEVSVASSTGVAVGTLTHQLEADALAR